MGLSTREIAGVWQELQRCETQVPNSAQMAELQIVVQTLRKHQLLRK
jgi:hypothetical protein